VHALIWCRDMPSNNMTGSLPGALGDLEQLVYLDLSRNELEGFIPKELGRLQQLVYLWLYENRLQGAIPAGLGGLERLTTLWLDHNRLTGIVPSLPFKNYTAQGGGCNLQDLTNQSNLFSCPLPPVRPRVHMSCPAAAPPTYQPRALT
jgi:Leucine-rich repeat (LRR) protein